MKRHSLILIIALACTLLGFTATPQPRPADSTALDPVLKKMDDLAATFRTAQADF